MGEAQRYSAMEMRSHGNRGGKSGGKGGGKRKRDGDGDDPRGHGRGHEADHELQRMQTPWQTHEGRGGARQEAAKVEGVVVSKGISLVRSACNLHMPRGVRCST